MRYNDHILQDRNSLMVAIAALRGSFVVCAFGLGLSVLAACSGERMPGAGAACEPGWVELGGGCTKVCSGDADCAYAAGLSCDTERQLCVPLTGDCASPTDCRPQACTMTDRTRCEDGQCVYEECASGYVCSDGSCELRPGLGTACSGPADCADGLKCQAGVCCDSAGGPCCTSNADCESGLACDTAAFSCRTSCVDFESTDCADPETLVCLANACVALAELGADCSEDSECKSGHCANGVCCESDCMGLCQQCGSDGLCDDMPADDAACGVLDCDVLDTACRDYHDITTGSCAAFGLCKVPNAETCTAFEDRSAETVCATANGDCDLDDHCDGAGKCVAEVKPASTVCRPLVRSRYTGIDPITCDIEEKCDGVSPACPEDKIRPAGWVCRVLQGSCDVEEICDGVSKSCPEDGFRPNTHVCRQKADQPGKISCDVEETCTGTSYACPADGFMTASTTCRAAEGECDWPENCPGDKPFCPDPGSYKSTEYGCRPPVFASDGSTCDAAEYCNGTSPNCPANQPAAAGTLCRYRSYLCPDADRCCDKADSCDGVHYDCADTRQAESYVCRPAAGDCDIAETCAASSDKITCPADAKSIGACRTATDTCDATEYCDGSSNACPSADIKAPRCTACGTGLACDGSGSCTTSPCGAGKECCGGQCCMTGQCCGGQCGCAANETCCGGSCWPSASCCYGVRCNKKCVAGMCPP